ncbi:MAG: MopE-related protein, partial [Myxococcota bacterium]|nr:MopE-related protein [Myxococcota bacterium]
MRSHAPALVVFRIVVALTSALASGCSLTGLDQFVWPGCEQCDALNVRDGIDPTTSCMLWQCTGEDQTLCELGPLDFDRDNHVALHCGGDDCNDRELVVHPGADEQCNGLDDDCNDYIDDGSRAPEPAIAILATTGTASWATYRSMTDELVMAYGTGAGTMGAGIERVRESTPITTGSIALELASTAPTYGLTQEETATGCAVRTSAAFPLPFCSEADACPAGEECVTSVGGDRLCGRPLSATPTAGVCNSDAECEDGIFCNGVESCQPSSPFSNAMGCRPMVAGACTGEEVCVEEGRLCTDVSASLTPCGISDVAIAPAGDDWLAAAITTAGCGHGSLRVGYFGLMPRAPESRYPAIGDVVLRGDRGGLRSTSWTGVDVTAAERCPGPDTGRATGAP